VSGPEFFQTRMGHTFYEGTMPRLVKAIEHLDARCASIELHLATIGKHLGVLADRAAHTSQDIDPNKDDGGRAEPFDPPED
jgi:hypothetical protein